MVVRIESGNEKCAVSTASLVHRLGTVDERLVFPDRRGKLTIGPMRDRPILLWTTRRRKYPHRMLSFGQLFELVGGYRRPQSLDGGLQSLGLFTSFDRLIGRQCRNQRYRLRTATWRMIICCGWPRIIFRSWASRARAENGRLEEVD